MVVIVPYRDTWPAEFASIATTQRAALGDLALRIDHIGSTAVPGLAAKDRIDIQITVADLDPPVEVALESIGYTNDDLHATDHARPGFVGDAREWEKWFFVEPDDQRPTNTHVRVAGRENQRFALLFRDFLREDETYAETYARLKRALAGSLADPQTYPEVKDPAVDLIYLAAERWAADISWEPGPSDA